jgi:hypothetical protein
MDKQLSPACNTIGVDRSALSAVHATPDTPRWMATHSARCRQPTSNALDAKRSSILTSSQPTGAGGSGARRLTADNVQENDMTSGGSKTVSATTECNANTDPSGRRKGIQLLAELELRDYFAAKAMLGICSNPDCSAPTYEASNHDRIAEVAFRIADAMLKARGEPK